MPSGRKGPYAAAEASKKPDRGAGLFDVVADVAEERPQKADFHWVIALATLSLKGWAVSA